MTPRHKPQYSVRMDHVRNHSPGEPLDLAPPSSAVPLQSGSLLSSEDVYLFNEGTHFHLYDKLGAHPTTF